MPPEGSKSPSPHISPLPVFFETDEPAVDSWAMTDVPNSMLKSDDSKKARKHYIFFKQRDHLLFS